jgi:small subunit ribosomal protein S12
MATLAQVVRPEGRRTKKSPLSRTPRLRACPQARGLVVRVTTMSPKKPNSAKRHVAKMRLYSKPRVTARIPGSGFGVTRFNRALVRGGRANDLPGVAIAWPAGPMTSHPALVRSEAAHSMAWRVLRPRHSASAASFDDRRRLLGYHDRLLTRTFSTAIYSQRPVRYNSPELCAVGRA